MCYTKLLLAGKCLQEDEKKTRQGNKEACGLVKKQESKREREREND